MTRLVLERRTLALFAILGFFMLSTFPLLAQGDPTQEPEATAQATPGPVEVTFGSGPFNLLAPTFGLADLSSYQAMLTLTFEGTNAGQAVQWKRTYTMLVARTPPARQLTIETSEDSADQVFMAEIGGTLYERRAGSSCTARAVQVAGAFAERWEPAGFLYGLIGANEAGTETIDGVAADHYTFDEFAQGAAGIADSTGELWVASQGGYLVRYTLTTIAGPQYFGDGVEGALSWDYQLSSVNQPLVIERPDDCPPGTLDLPVLPDAADLVQIPGYTSYSTASGVDEVVAFYKEQVAAAGAQVANPPLISGNGAVYGFTQADQPVLLSASRVGDQTSVQLQSVADPAALAIAAEVPPIVIAAEDTLGDCAAGGVPVLPDASDVISLPGGLNY
ncbi:MAG: hypothetical protein IT323_04715, partial [Anaerolineae bacterium]|nr:hypothetical protein [Anaerolineae bacterium]